MQSRRTFLQTGIFVAAAVGTSTPVLSENIKNNKGDQPTDLKNGTITFLQTTDVHCQLHSHDELFWENEKVTFRKTGGYAHLAAALDALKLKNPENTITVDTGDMFQGSLLSVKQKAMRLSHC